MPARYSGLHQICRWGARLHVIDEPAAQAMPKPALTNSTDCPEIPLELWAGRSGDPVTFANCPLPLQMD